LKYILIVLLLALNGCAVNAETCRPVGPNYLKNADFAQLTASGGALHWTAVQHAGEPSFEVTYEGDEVTVNKTGTQPWLMLKQRLRETDLGGKKVALSAQIKLNLRPPAIYHGFKQGGGLQLTATSNSSARQLLKSTLDHMPHIGVSDWTNVQVVLKMPARVSNVEVSLLHQADGVLQVRNPSLRRIDDSDRKCRKTKVAK